MPFELTDEQHELVSTARKLLADSGRADPVPPAFQARDAGLNRNLWRSLAELGLLGLAVPEERGGSGAGLHELCLLAEQVGVAVPRVPFSGTAAVLAIAAMGANGRDVSAIVDGSVIAVPAWETFPFIPDHRSDALRLAGSAVRGSLRAVPFGLDADLLLAFADDTPVLLDLAQAGVERGTVSSFDVTEPAATIELNAVPATILTPGEFSPRVLTVLAAELIGTGQRALDGAVEYARQRFQFGRAIGSYQAIKHMLADRFVQLDAARLLVERAAMAIDDERPDAQATQLAAARTALAAASAAAEAAAADALQTHGGIGFTWEHPSHVFLRRARARRSLLGSPARQLDALAGHIFGP